MTLAQWEGKTFDGIVEAWQGHAGTRYEEKKGLTPRCVTGTLQNDDVGTITYVTDDNRIGLIMVFRSGPLWKAFYPTEDQFNYLFNDAKIHIEAVLQHNEKMYKVDKMSDNINREDFKSKFLTIEAGDTKDVRLTNWRQESKTFQDSDKTRPALVFDVTEVDKTPVNPVLEWSTTSAVLAQDFFKMIDKADLADKAYLLVRMKRTNDKKYMVIDLSDR